MKSPFLLFILALSAAQTLIGHGGSESHSHPPSNVDAIPEFVINPQNKSNPWTHLALNNNPDSFQFAIVTDNTGGMRPGVFSDAVSKLNLLQPEFVMSVGDLINGYTENEPQLVSEWDEFDAMVANLQMPFFYVAGNHDYTNDVMAELWTERYGASYYHFVYRDTLFIMLNSNDGGGIHTMSQRQVGWLQGVLEANPDPRWTLVFVHAPLWDTSSDGLWPEVDALLEGRKYTVFAGHHHRYVKRQRNGSKYFTLATTGGGSQLRGPRFGEFDHVMWVTMSDEGPILANLMLEGIWSEDIRDEELRDRQAAVIDGGKLGMQPILYRDSLDNGTSELRLTNDTNLPYHFKADFSQIANVILESERSLSLTVPPNEVKTIPIQIGSSEVTSGDFKVLQMDWSLSFLGETEQQTYEGVETLNIIQEQAVPIIKSPTADGKLSDWKSIPLKPDNGIATYHPENWTDEKDASFEWAIAASTEALHIAVKVNDQAIVRNPDKGAWYQDNIYVQVDARPAAARLRNRSSPRSDSGALVACLMPPVDRTEQNLELRNLKTDDSKFAYAVVPSKNGYIAELSIPFSELDAAAKGNWQQLRFNILQIDYDPGEDSRAIRQRIPNWSDSESLLGAGSFYRQN